MFLNLLHSINPLNTVKITLFPAFILMVSSQNGKRDIAILYVPCVAGDLTFSFTFRFFILVYYTYFDYENV